MAQISGTLDTYAQKGKKEDFRDIIYTIAVSDLPFMSLAGTAKNVKSTRHQWQTDSLRAPAMNAKIQGDQASFTAPQATVEVCNYTQISNDTLSITDTAKAIALYGRGSDKKRLKLKKAQEVMRDIEGMITARNTASLAGDSTTAALSGSLTSWVTTNASRGVGGANGGYNSGTGLTVAATDGTQRAFAESHIKDVMESCFNNGAKNPRIVMLSPKHKKQFSAFVGNAANRVNQTVGEAKKGQSVIMAAAEFYQSDFGLLTAVPNPFMSSAMGGATAKPS